MNSFYYCSIVLATYFFQLVPNSSTNSAVFKAVLCSLIFTITFLLFICLSITRQKNRLRNFKNFLIVLQFLPFPHCSVIFNLTTFWHKFNNIQNWLLLKVYFKILAIFNCHIFYLFLNRLVHI